MEWSEKNKQIKELYEMAERKEATDIELEKIKVRLNKEKAEFYKAQKDYTKECNDVEELNSNKIKSTFLSILGKKDDAEYKEMKEMQYAGEKLQKEEREYLAVKSEYEKLIRIKKEFGNFEEELAILMKEKECYILTTNTHSAERIRDIQKEEKRILADIEDLSSCLTRLNKVINLLEKMAGCLGGARNAAAVDSILGSNIVVDAFEHRNYSQAKIYMEEAKKEISEIINMTDSYRHPLSLISLQVDINGFDFAADVLSGGGYRRRNILTGSRGYSSENNLLNKANASLTRTETAIEIVENYIESRNIIINEKVESIQRLKAELRNIIVDFE